MVGAVSAAGDPATSRDRRLDFDARDARACVIARSESFVRCHFSISRDRATVMNGDVANFVDSRSCDECADRVD
jgi:hypothetical protein